MRASALSLALALSSLLIACGTDESPTPPAKSTAGTSTVDSTPPDAPPVSKAPTPEPVATDWREIPWISPLEERVIKPGHAPAPFLKSEIRAALVPGLRWAVRSDPRGGPPETVIREVVSRDEQGIVIRMSFRNDAGVVDHSATSEHAIPWKLAALTPSAARERVTISRERITVPAGEFDCIRIHTKDALREGDSETLWYAREIPFCAVRQSNVLFGRRLSDHELVEYSIPETVALPASGVEDAAEADVLVELDEDGTVRVGDASYAFGAEDQVARGAALEGFANAIRLIVEREAKHRNGPRATTSILIRSHRDAKWQWVQWMMQILKEPPIGITKLRFAVTPEAKPSK